MDPDRPMGDETHKFLEQHYSAASLEQFKAMARRLAGARAGQVDVSSLTVEAFLKAARHHRQLQDHGKFKAWMRKILVRDVLARLHLESHRRTQAFEADRLCLLPDRQETEDRPEQEEETARIKAYLSRLLALIPDDDREVICLCRLQGLPDAAAAELLGITEPALRQRRCRALRRLKELARQYPHS